MRKIAVSFISFILILSVQNATAQSKNFETDVFLYGASVYPELQTRDQQIKMLDLFHKAGLTVLRVGESAWGNLEPASGKFTFGWLQFFLDEMQKRNIKAILGTCSYIPPQWLAAKHPEVLWRYEDGSHANPMGRHAASRNHPLFRKELKKFILAYGAEFKDHPAVIGWQLDNEIEWTVGSSRIDHNPASLKAWKEWLKKNYRTKEEINKRLGLNAWGLQADSLENVPQPTRSNDGDLPALRLASLHFQRDNIMDYFRWQKSLLREAGVKQWITTDWMMVNHTLADEPKETNPIDISGINQYQPTDDDPDYWMNQAMFNDIHRSVNGNGRFIVTETRIGPAGGQRIWTPTPSHGQFITWLIEPVAFGANGLLHWSGNRFNAGHWPHWGGMLDWTGKPEPDFLWVEEISAFYKKWSHNLITNTVDAKAAVLTDFDQRAALEVYQHTTSDASNRLLPEAFDAFHRNGIGVDAINMATAANYQNLKKYKLLVIAAAPGIDGKKLTPALREFVEKGGTLVVTPFTGYQTWDGVFHSSGFAADLKDLTGSFVQTVRLLGDQIKYNKMKRNVKWNPSSWNIDTSGIGMDGFVELLDVSPGVEVLAHFATDEQIINKLPAATLNKIGNGNVLKLAFWPGNNDFTQVIREVAKTLNPYIRAELPAGVQAVPRTDSSLFIINTLNKNIPISLKKPMTDRITGTPRSTSFELKPHETIWIE